MVDRFTAIKENNKNIKDELERSKKEQEDRERKEKKKALEDAEDAERKIAQQAAYDSILKDAQHKDINSGQLTSYWEKMLHQAETSLQSDVNTLIDWRAAMFSVLKLCFYLVRAIHNSVEKKLWFPLATNGSEGLTQIGRSELFEKNIYPFIDNIKDKLHPQPEMILPFLTYGVNYTEDNKLQVDPLIRSDKEATVDAINTLFKKGVDLWLKECGYAADPKDEGRYKQVNTGEVLTKAVFETLKKDHENGLQAFFEQGDEVSLRPSMP